MLFRREYYSLQDVADALQLTTKDLIHIAVLGRLNIATYVDIEGINVEPYPLNASDTVIYSSGLYYIHKKDLIKFEFNHGQDSIKIKYIYPINICMQDFDFSPEFPNPRDENLVHALAVDYLDEGILCPSTDKYFDDEAFSEISDKCHHDNNTLLSYTIAGDYSVHIKDLVITHTDYVTFTRDELSKLEQRDISINEHNIVHTKVSDDMIAHQGPSKVSSVNKGGKPKGPLAKAVEFAYLKLRKEGNEEILLPGNIREFLTRLKKLADEKENRNILNEVPYWIEDVKKHPWGFTITTSEQFVKVSQHREVINKSTVYQMKDVSKILTKLRKDYPLQT